MFTTKHETVWNKTNGMDMPFYFKLRLLTFDSITQFKEKLGVNVTISRQ